jgi:hypothetical protein
MVNTVNGTSETCITEAKNCNGAKMEPIFRSIGVIDAGNILRTEAKDAGQRDWKHQIVFSKARLRIVAIASRSFRTFRLKGRGSHFEELLHHIFFS